MKPGRPSVVTLNQYRRLPVDRIGSILLLDAGSLSRTSGLYCMDLRWQVKDIGHYRTWRGQPLERPIAGLLNYRTTCMRGLE